jgi:hypothetical protein
MTPSLRNLLLIVIRVAALSSSASAGDTPPPGRYIEVEIERDMGKGTASPLLDEATLEKFRKWRFKPKKVRRVKIPMMYRYIPPAVPSGPTVI